MLATATVLVTGPAHAGRTALAGDPPIPCSSLGEWVGLHGFSGSGVPQPVNPAAPGPHSITVVVRDFFCVPIAGASVEFDFSGCDANICDVDAGGGTFNCTVSGGKVLATSDAQGEVTLVVFGSAHNGGPVGGAQSAGADAPCVTVRADGVILGQISFFSYDQNGGPPIHQPGVTGVDAALATGDALLRAASASNYRTRSDVDVDGTNTGVDAAIITGVALLSQLGFSNGCYLGIAAQPYCP